MVEPFAHLPRWVELAGAHNVRDLGGLSAGGRRVRSGVLLRGDHLDDVTDDDLRVLRDEFGDDVAGVYRHMLEVAAPELVAILQFVVEEHHAPALVHCAAGKDRTGITVAVLLAAAGVDEPGIVADYVATGERLDRIRAALARRELYRHMQRSVPANTTITSTAIEGVLDALRTEDGGAEGFLVRHGAPRDTVDRWRELLLEPAG